MAVDHGDDMDLFGGTDAAGGLRADVRLDVAKLDYLSSESMTWQELFGGFGRMRAITYSSGIGVKGSDTSAYVLLYMPDRGESEMTGSAADCVADLV